MATGSSHIHPPIPSLPNWPLLGNIFALRKKRLELLQRISQQCGDIGAFHFGPRIVPVLNSPDFIRQVLVEQGSLFEKTAMVRALGTPVLGNSIFLSEGEEHRRQRKLLAPLFHQRRVPAYGETMSTCTAQLVELWNEGETLNLADEMMGLTLRIITSILFAADISGEERELGDALTFTFQYFAGAVTNPLRLPLCWPTPQNRRVQRALARINTTISRMIEERRQCEEKRDDMLSALLWAYHEEQGTPLSDEQVRNEALSFFIAGHETTATALTWCCSLLAQHPDIYTKVQKEGDRLLAGRLPTVADLSALPYTLQVFKEALRLYPPVYAFTRRAISSIELGEYCIPKGASVVISPYTLHRRSDFYPDPERFVPERFAAEQEQQLPRYAYLPFGAGAHICPGMHLAQMEGHLILATLAQRLTFEYVGSRPIQPRPFLTLRPEGAVLVRVHRR